jgi:hypothetical protein
MNTLRNKVIHIRSVVESSRKVTGYVLRFLWLLLKPNAILAC